MRIAALSDQHGHLPAVPQCDLLIVAGDVCPDRIGPYLAHREPEHQKAWFDTEARSWLAGTPASHRILTWGNHDWCGQACRFDADAPGVAPTTALQIVVDAPTMVANGMGGRPFSIWATPWSNPFLHWAFMKPRHELERIYSAIPEGTDILVSHQPPYGLGDRYEDPSTGRVEHLGSHELLAAIDRVRPRLVICGHFHGGFGRFAYGDTLIYNVSLVNDQYQLVRTPAVIDLDPL